MEKLDKSTRLATLADELWPYFLDRLKNLEGIATQTSAENKAKNGGRTHADTPAPHSIYLPEIDLFVHSGMMNGAFRGCGFSRKGTLNLEPLNKCATMPVGLFVEGSNNDALQYYIVPCPSLKTYVDAPYDVKYTWDYRIHKESYTRYMAGVLDVVRQDAAKNNLRVREIAWRESDGDTPIPQKVIDNTRKYWETMPEDGGSHIVTKATMFEVLDMFESGLMVPGQVPWRIDVSQSGIELGQGMYEVDRSDLYQPMKISLIKGV